MIENEKARSDAATPEQANESVSANTTFIDQSNIKRRGVQAFLLEGEANALPMRELARLVGVSERQVRKIIERERRNGSMILSFPELDRLANVVFCTMKPYIDEAFDDYEKQVQAGRSGARKRWNDEE